MNLLIMGPAGAGKGTMSDLILKEYNIPHISTGDMLRANIRQNSELGLKAKVYMESGKLVPDDLINAMVEKRIQEDDCKKGYLLDGYPRTLVQAKEFDKMADKISRPVECVLWLDVDIKTLEERITGRRICPNCGTIYHVKNHAPKVDGICDNCGSKLVQRKDDTLEQLEVRMDEYEKSTRPVIDYYQDKGLVVRLNGNQSSDKVFEEVKLALSHMN